MKCQESHNCGMEIPVGHPKTQNKAQEMPVRVTNIPMTDVRYLKHVGALDDVKVSAHVRNGIVCLHIRDYEFETFSTALRFLQEASREIVRTSHDLEVIQ